MLYAIGIHVRLCHSNTVIMWLIAVCNVQSGQEPQNDCTCSWAYLQGTGPVWLWACHRGQHRSQPQPVQKKAVLSTSTKTKEAVLPIQHALALLLSQLHYNVCVYHTTQHRIIVNAQTSPIQAPVVRWLDIPAIYILQHSFCCHRNSFAWLVVLTHHSLQNAHRFARNEHVQ